jgi:hypothetical protein
MMRESDQVLGRHPLFMQGTSPLLSSVPSYILSWKLNTRVPSHFHDDEQFTTDLILKD